MSEKNNKVNNQECLCGNTGEYDSLIIICSPAYGLTNVRLPLCSRCYENYKNRRS